MTKQKVLITLEPLKPYFFGGEQTFGPAGEHSNYFAKSRQVPQQTTLLGMLRYELLAIKGLLNNVDKNKADSLIGPKSFDGTSDQFGIIDKLSPLFMLHKDRPFVPLPRAHYYDGKSLRDYDLQLIGKEQEHSAFILKDEQGKDYNAKNYFANAWISAVDEKEVIKESCIFKNSEKVGIRKSQAGKTEDYAFYKQGFYTLEKDWKMAFIFSFKTKDNSITNFFMPGQKHSIELGGETSIFLMEIKEAIPEPSLPLLYRKSEKYEKLILKSDAYVKDVSALYNQAVFSIAEPVSFRNIRSENSNAKDFYWSKMDRSGKSTKTAPHKSGLHYLIHQGAVFFCEDATVFSKYLKYPSFEKIGYNRYDILLKAK